MPNHITLHDGQGKLPGSADFTYKGTIEFLLDYCFFHDFDYFLVVMKKSAGKLFFKSINNVKQSYEVCLKINWEKKVTCVIKFPFYLCSFMVLTEESLQIPIKI